MDEGWTLVKKGKNTNSTKSHKQPFYIKISNAYASLPQYAADPPPFNETTITNNKPQSPNTQQYNSVPSTFKCKARRRFLARQQRRQFNADEDKFLDNQITWAEDIRTHAAKTQQTKHSLAINHSHKIFNHKPKSILHNGRNAGYAFATAIKRTAQFFHQANHVHFNSNPVTHTFNIDDVPAVTYDSGADGHYLNESDRREANLPILKPSTKQVAVANGDVCSAKHVSKLPFPGLSHHAAQADTFADFPHSLMSVGKISDDGNVSIFTKEGVTVHREQDVLVTCKGDPILIGVRDDHGRYRIPLTQHRGQWQPRKPSKKARVALQQANSVYDLPSTEQAIKWLHAVCGYPVKSTWLKAVKAGNFVGWPLLTESNVKKYYPETVETPKGHLNQSRKNVRSTKTKPFEELHTNQLRGQKRKDIYTKVYDVRETIFTDQTGQFPTRSQDGNKYVMVMVEIDSSGILVEPIKNRSDTELTRAYESLLSRLKQAGITPRKHVLDNEVSAAMKVLIREKYKMEYELVPPGCHRRNAAEVAIRNFKAHFLSILAGVADDFPLRLWDKLLPQAEITINLLRQSNATPTISAYAHLNGPFDYNKMPLAPMGCNVQIHEKSDSRGTWAFHSVDGWYLNTSPEHYRTHKCYVKHTNNERFSDTVEFQHKRITNPTVTPADKIMKAISSCMETIRSMSAFNSNNDLQQLHRVLHDATTNPASFNNLLQQCTNEQPLPRVAPSQTQAPPQPPPRVEPNQRITRALAQQLYTAILPPTSPPRLIPTAARKKRKPSPAIPPQPSNPPAMNTRSRAKEKAFLHAPPAKNTRQSNLKQPTPSKLRGRIKRLENEVHQALAVMDKATGKMLNYRQLLRHPDYTADWSTSSANEFGRLANGVGGRIPNPTNTIKFISKADVPKDRRKDITYGSFVCTVRPEKKEPNRTRFVAGGNLTNYPYEVATPTADMLVAKILLNSVISTRNAKFMTMDISDFYLNTPMKRPEYIRLNIKDIPTEIIAEYNLKNIVDPDGSIYLKVVKGMYGLPQSGLIANELLEQRLNKHGYFQSKLVPGLWSHKTRPIWFTLVVDDFGVKYVGEEHALHLKSVIEKYYKASADWTGTRYIGITLDWDYNKRQVHLSMPGYKAKALKQFQHKTPSSPQHSPFHCAPIKYGAKKQYAIEESTAAPLDKKGKKFIQKVCGKFLFLGRAVDPTLLCPISAIAAQAANPTTDTLKQTHQLLDYIASQDDAVITYNASDMILAAHSDASYLSEPKARSRAGGHFFLSSSADIPPNNGAILNLAHIIKHVMASATEAELAALYIVAREAVYIRIILEELGHKQPATPLQTDNAMADAVCNGKIQPKRTKAMDMRFHWLRDRECQEQFRIYWRPGKCNYADYWTKHHPAKHHQNIRREFITPYLVLEMLRLQQLNQKAATAA